MSDRPSPDAANPLLESHARLREAERLRLAKALDEAQAICAELVKAHPNYVGALGTLGLIYAERRDYEGAWLNLSRAAMLNPRDWKILTALAGVYFKLGASEMAMRTLEQARSLKPEDASILVSLAEIYRAEREQELAAAASEQAHALDASSRATRIGLGRNLARLGRLDAAAAVFNSLAGDGPEDLSVLFGLSQLPPGLASVDVLKSLGNLRARPGQPPDEFAIEVAFARAAALDRAKRHPEAWRELVDVNARIFAPLAEAAHKEEQSRIMHLELLRGFATLNYPVSTKQPACQSLFILGPPRSGKTTTERLAALLPGVRRGYENPIVENAIRRTFQGAGFITRSQLAELPSQLDQVFCQTYLAELAERAKGALVFTNTRPGRIIDACRMASVLPGVRFIFVKRDAYDLALRIYMKRYQSSQNPFSYDLKALFRYIAWYNAMMDVIAGQFPGIVRILAYEDIVADPKRALATIAEFCGLPLPDTAISPLTDDRGAAAPYREVMEKALNAG